MEVNEEILIFAMSNQTNKDMKQVKVTIKGELIVVDYCSKALIETLIDMGLEEEDEFAFTANYYMTCCWNTVDGLYIDGGEENMVKQKGKYVKTKEYWHSLIGEESDHPVPVTVHWRHYYDQWFDYIIELEDEDEFDIKKVQIIKSEYEIDLFPYFIRADVILYDGKEIKTTENWGDYDVEGKIYNEGEITELYD